MFACVILLLCGCESKGTQKEKSSAVGAAGISHSSPKSKEREKECTDAMKLVSKCTTDPEQSSFLKRNYEIVVEGCVVSEMAVLSQGDFKCSAVADCDAFRSCDLENRAQQEIGHLREAMGLGKTEGEDVRRGLAVKGAKFEWVLRQCVHQLQLYKSVPAFSKTCDEFIPVAIAKLSSGAVALVCQEKGASEIRSLTNHCSK